MLHVDFCISVLLAVLLLWILQVVAIDRGQYVGCFRDGADRAMPGGYVRLDGATVDLCVGRCTGLGFKYAGLQDFSACFCANVFDKYGGVPESQCNSVCPGNSAQNCGGNMRNSVWETGAYIGCYKDDSPRAMGSWERIAGSTVGKCINKCKRQRFQYAGMQDSSACFCANTYATYGSAPEYECDDPCPGNSRQTCGGSMRNSVWKTA